MMFTDPALWLQGLLWLHPFDKVFFQLFQLMPPWTLLLHDDSFASIDRHTHHYFYTSWVHNRQACLFCTLLYIILYYAIVQFRNRRANDSCTDNSLRFHLEIKLSSNLRTCHVYTALTDNCHHRSILSYQFHAIYLHAILQYASDNYLSLSRLPVVDLVH